MKNANNYLKVTLIKIKIPNEVDISSFNLKMEFAKQTQETEKFTSKEADINKVRIYIIIFYFLFHFTSVIFL
jgi:hypothetical protein